MQHSQACINVLLTLKDIVELVESCRVAVAQHIWITLH